jgi:hypothetical protein
MVSDIIGKAERLPVPLTRTVRSQVHGVQANKEHRMLGLLTQVVNKKGKTKASAKAGRQGHENFSAPGCPRSMPQDTLKAKQAMGRP